jgi:SAM-dependent methyltransferase
VVSDGPYPETKEVIGGFVVIDAASREEALAWAAKIAAACRCAQEVREIMPDPEIEAMLAHVRRCCALRFAADGTSDMPTAFLAALARHCFFNGYAFALADDERALARRLQGEARTKRDVVLAALYQPLAALLRSEWASDLADPDVGQLIREQIVEPARERDIAQSIVAITPIDGDVSQAVREMYEENPYPRWSTIAQPIPSTIDALAGRLRPDRPTVATVGRGAMLVAGCGTGHHSLQMALAFPDLDVLAVDLSRRSLAYAMRMTEQLGVTNITYRQADLLKLPTLGRRFAMIACGGVLHHLKDPMSGFRALIGVLADDGLMSIALYSETARAPVNAARRYLASLDLPGGNEGIRRARQAIMALPAGDPCRDVMRFADFFTIDGCRDLLFHVQEHQFTIPRIGQSLDALGLRLLEFETSAAVRSRFVEMFPGRDPRADLGAWHEFEQRYPAAFTGMYAFWCSRK